MGHPANKKKEICVIHHVCIYLIPNIYCNKIYKSL